MKIGELARLTDVSTSSIRFYEKHGLLPPPTRLENGYREYPETIVSRMKTISMSKALGFSLSEIRKFLPDDPKEILQRQDVISNLESKLVDIDQRVEDLQSMSKNVKAMIAYLKDPNSNGC